MITWHHVIDIAFVVGATSSALHSLLPPWDWNPPFVEEGLADFPRLQDFLRRLIALIFHNRYYKLLIYILGGFALALRSTVWRGSISMPVQFQKREAENGKL